MASLVNPFNINGNYPIAGQDNDSQGFRDNFTNIKNNFIFIKQEVEDMQSKVILKSALSGSTLDNNFLGSQVKNIQTKNLTETVYDWGEVGAATATEIQLDFALGNIHKLNATGSIKINAVIKNFPSALQYSRLMLYINISTVANTLELPSTLTTDLASIPGLRTIASSKLITFTDAGDYIFEFSSVDSGTTVFVRELTRGNPVFRDPNFYMAGIGTYEVPTLRLGWGNLFAVSSKIDSNTKAGTDTFSVRGGITSYQNFADGGNDPTLMKTAGFSVAKSRTADPGAAGALTLTDTVVNANDYLGYFNGLAYTKNKDDSNNSFQQMAVVGMYATGSNTSYGLGGNIVISTKRDGGALTTAMTIDNNQDVVLVGNLTVNGTTTTINSTVLTVDDKNIIIAQGVSSATLANASGITIDTAFANIEYVNSGAQTAQDDRWSFNKAVTIGIATESNATTTGALVVGGGVAIAGTLNVGGTFGLTATTEATTTTSAAFALGGGIAAVKNIIAGGALFANSTATTSNLASGAFQVRGGAMIRGNLYVGGQQAGDEAGGVTQTGLYVLSTSTSGNTASGAVVVKGGMGVAGPVYLADASSANGVTVSSTLHVNGKMLTEANATSRSATAAFRVKGGSIFESNVVFGTGAVTNSIGQRGHVFIDNALNVTAGDITTGGLVLGNATALVGASISGDVNIGTTDSGAIYILNRENAFGTPITGTLTPYQVSLTGGGAVQLGAVTALGGMNVFNDMYIGQPHSLNNIVGWTANPGTTVNNYLTLGTNPYFGTPIGAASGNVYLSSGARGLSYTSGALQIRSVTFADGSTSDGGAGIAGNLYVNRAGFIGTLGSSTNYGNLVAASSTESTVGGTGATGSLVVLGGAGIVSKLNVGGVIAANAAVASTSKITGAIVIPGGGLGVSGGITAGNIGLDAGTTSQESLLIPTGTLLTTPRVGAVEHSSGVWYATPAASSRAVIPVAHTFVLGANASINGGTAPVISTFYSAFGGASGTAGTFTAVANTDYEFEIRLNLTYGSPPLAPTSHDLAFTFGGTATYNQYSYDTLVYSGLPGDGGAAAVAPTPTAPVMTPFFALGSTTSTAVTMPTAAGSGRILAASTALQVTVRISGVFRVIAGGTVIPQLAWLTAPARSVSAMANSSFRVTPFGTGMATIGVGNFVTS
jgi:hypothetical protein